MRLNSETSVMDCRIGLGNDGGGAVPPPHARATSRVIGVLQR
jgi:hypothetical protein